MRNRFLMTMCLVCVSGLLSAASARAVIMVLIPLNSVVDKEEFIFIARVKEILPDKPAMVLAFDENLKGKAPFERMPVNLTGDAEAKKDKHTEVLLDRIDKDTPIVIITTKRGGRYIAFGFTNGTWFQMEGRIEKQDDKEVVRWSFLHCEPYLVRTFKGTTEELKQIVVDAVAKKKAPPPPNEKEKPGFGPPIKKSSGVGGFPFAVIQLPFLGLIAALAALFQLRHSLHARGPVVAAPLSPFFRTGNVGSDAASQIRSRVSDHLFRGRFHLASDRFEE
ncbi:MAG: hypothetical protein K8T89_12145 [Planctomycetes bacterium]|nr:hypothetical protein [Planctomycetota bacterium]